jgi:hypothetical protein
MTEARRTLPHTRHAAITRCTAREVHTGGAATHNVVPERTLLDRVILTLLIVHAFCNSCVVQQQHTHRQVTSRLW